MAFLPANPCTSVIFFFFFQMSDWACPSKAEFIIRLFSGISRSKGVKTHKASHNLLQNLARLSSGSCSTRVVLATLAGFFAPSFTPCRREGLSIFLQLVSSPPQHWDTSKSLPLGSSSKPSSPHLIGPLGHWPGAIFQPLS